MKKNILLAIILSLGVFSQSQATETKNETNKLKGFYVGATYSGFISHKDKKGEDEFTTSAKPEFGLTAGYLHDISPEFALGAEIGFRNKNNAFISAMGTDTENKYNLHDRAIAIALKAQIKVNEEFNLFAKAGLVKHNYKVDTNRAFPNDHKLKNNRSKIGGEFSFGAGYNINKNLSITAALRVTPGTSWKNFMEGKDSYKNVVLKRKDISLGLNYNF